MSSSTPIPVDKKKRKAPDLFPSSKKTSNPKAASTKPNASKTSVFSHIEGMKQPPKPPPTAAAANQNFTTMSPPLSESTLLAISKVLNKAEGKSSSSSTSTSIVLPPPTPVQAVTIPLLLTNKDVAVQALTGSGKTLAYVIPSIELILRKGEYKPDQIGVLIITPTRELATQVHSIVKVFTHCAKIAPPLLVIGGGAGSAASGRSVQDDLHSFVTTKADIIVGTPGRIHDILTRYDTVDVRELDLLILDEADTLLSMGFDHQIGGILKSLPSMRRTGLFSATMTREVKELGKAGLRNPVVINVNINAAPRPSSNQDQASEGNSGSTSAVTTTPSTLTNYYVISPLPEKLSRLATFLVQHKDQKSMVFFLTCACVDFFGNALQSILGKELNYIELLHGKMVQKRRENTLNRFRDAKSGSLLCTDVAARGLDVTDINWVVQFDAPQDPSYFVHRVGRAARAGRTGKSVLFLSEEEGAYVDFLKLRKVPIAEMSADGEECLREVEVDKSSLKEEVEEEELEEEDDEEEKEKGEEENVNDADAMVVEDAASQSKSNIQIPNINLKVKGLVLKDRDYLEKGTKAFTSYIRAYKEHDCSFIFRFPSLDLGDLATAFCLLRLPKMPELKDSHANLNFRPAGPEVDIHKIGFSDKVREKARQARLAKELAAGGKNAKQIKAEMKAAEKIRRAKMRKDEAKAKGRNPDKKRGKQQQIYDDWDELAKEERLNKKLRKGKITKEEYKNLIRGEKKNKGEDEMIFSDSDDCE